MQSMGKFLTGRSGDGFTFRPNAPSGRTVPVLRVCSGEAGCVGGVESVRTGAPIANLEDRAVESCATEIHRGV